ncbi:peptidyl-prolyl cis-trans isomerase D [Rubricella aquisinus]|uniref:Peptidyl-prolyl cis-trans isomerase D n=1 Tax=Rubricella aquisinus TaxID=2028108 RepID=A0A840WYI9_9RHOB|nr:peptidylprolyl isomerase [Rubricella aquisinus]MBB5514736.1 peptidyl-prolyl cis-trans isomerase D [Rubricella aquisinus]
MLSSIRASRGSVFGWIIMGLLIVGLAGFGFTSVLSGGVVTSVAEVGEEEVTVDEFANAFQTRLRGISQQIGTPITTTQAREIGLDDAILGELIRNAALLGEARTLGIDTSDEVVRDALIREPAFQDISGNFDADLYRLAIETSGISAAEYDEQLRRGTTRDLIALAMTSSVTLPRGAAREILSFQGEGRAFDWVRVPGSAFTDRVGSPSDAQLEAFIADNRDAFVTPETRSVTYALLDPTVLAETIDIPEAALREEYDRNIDRFTREERRIVDRIAFPTMADAEAAATALAEGQTSIGEIASARGLTAADFSLGSVTRGAIGGAAGEALFGRDSTGIVGPVTTDIGPALFRINAILSAQEITFEQARDDLRTELALFEADGIVINETIRAEELILGGATLEEVAAETAFTLQTAEVNRNTPADTIIGAPAFLGEAFTAPLGMDRDPIQTETGAVFALRVESVAEPALPPLNDIRDAVTAAWTEAQAVAEARNAAARLISGLTVDGPDLSAIAAQFGTDVQSVEPIRRDARPDGIPAGLVPLIFTMDEGDVALVEDAQGAVIFQLTEIDTFDPASDTGRGLVDFVTFQSATGAQQDVIAYFTNARSTERGLRINTQIIDQVLSQIP